MPASALPVQLTPIYTGSVKNVLQNPDDNTRLYFEFTDDYSVFDYGKMPDAIEGKGHALTVMGAVLMQRLADANTWKLLAQTQFPFSVPAAVWSSGLYQRATQKGFLTHYVNLVDKETLTPVLPTTKKPALMQVNAATVIKPTQNTDGVYEYPALNYAADQPVFVPLEVVFRLGLPQGSSLLSKLQHSPELLAHYGLMKTPTAGDWLPKIQIDFYTKLEPQDRLLSDAEAKTIACLNSEQLDDLKQATQLLALWLFAQLQQVGITLWDGKFEFAYSPQTGFILVDTIGPDELRLTYNGVQLSKECLRQYYRSTTWYQQLLQGHSETPPVLPANTKQAVVNLYSTLQQVLSQNNSEQSKVLLDELSQQLSTL